MQKHRSTLRVSFSLLLAIAGLTISMLTFAEEPPAGGVGSITVEQENTFSSVMGSWTLILPSSNVKKGLSAKKTVDAIPSGSYTLIVNAPAGMKSSIRLYENGKQISFADRPQLSFVLADGGVLRAVIHHVPDRIGQVVVQSDPTGLPFSLEGPDNMKLTGTTPASIPEAPEGRYTVQFEPLEGCGKIPPRSGKLIKDGRLSLSVTLKCDRADAIRKEREAPTDLPYLSVRIGDRDFPFTDVPNDAWFAAFIARAVRQNILGGYKDATGSPTGEFKPTQHVTLAELAKIAHRMAGIDEKSFVASTPENTSASGQWFSPFVASAENRGWTVFIDDPLKDLLRPATRAEVIVTIMQIFDKPLHWQTGTVFSDVSVRTRYAAAIETAASDGLITKEDLFRPNDPINRAEIAKLIAKALEVYRGVEE